MTPKTKILAFNLLQRVRTHRPLVHHLTNWVTIYDCANIVKVLGASPVMAHAPEEVAQMAGLASSVVLNIGTLTVDLVEAMKIAARTANARGIPVVLDACGAGATDFRDQKCFELLEEARIDLIKGNASEITRLSGEKVRTRGVEATEVHQDLVEAARALAHQRLCTVVVTGPEDIVVGKGSIYRVKNGHPMMSQIVGTGCMATSMIGTFAAVEPDLAYAAVAALVCFEVAAEAAVRISLGPGIYKERIFDCLARLDQKTLDRQQKVEICEDTISSPTRP